MFLSRLLVQQFANKWGSNVSKYTVILCYLFEPFLDMLGFKMYKAYFSISSVEKITTKIDTLAIVSNFLPESSA